MKDVPIDHICGAGGDILSRDIMGKDEALAVSSFVLPNRWCTGSQLFDAIQPHGLRVWGPATGTSVVHQKAKGRKRGRKRDAIIITLTNTQNEEINLEPANGSEWMDD